jgi:hypothetical protein
MNGPIHSQKEALVYNAERRFQSQALHTPAQHTPLDIVAMSATNRRNLLRTILEALSWLGEIRAMPFVGLDLGLQHDKRPERDY